MIKQLFLTLLLTSVVYADETPLPHYGGSQHYSRHHHRPYWETDGIMPAKDARDIIMQEIRSKHFEAVEWWVTDINEKIRIESLGGSASLLINISVANSDVQNYLEMQYERVGYHAEITPGWDKERNAPNGQQFLSLSW